MRKSVAAMLLEDSIGKTFDALGTGAADKGTYVETLKYHRQKDGS